MRAETLAVAQRLAWIHTTAVGVGWLPLSDLRARSIPVTNSRGLHAGILAEHAIALLLGLRRQLPLAAQRRLTRDWAQEEIAAVTVPRLADTTVLVIGLGEIGARVAQMAAGLGMQVIGVRRDLKRDLPIGVSRVVGLSGPEDVLPRVDAVILAVPHTAEVGVILDAAAIGRLRPGAMVVNVARGTLVDEAALADALNAGRLGGAGLDVLAEEPPPADSPLWTTPRTILTPHTGALDGDYWTPAVDFFLDNWERFITGEPLQNLVDLDRGY
jgi:phosphoglycerate dehydrogenase-like enzyme